MKITIKNGKFETGSLFKLVIVGYTIGVSTVFLAFVPLMLIALLSEGTGKFLEGLLTIPMIPLIAFFQALMLSAVTVFGLYTYNKFKGIEITTE